MDKGKMVRMKTITPAVLGKIDIKIYIIAFVTPFHLLKSRSINIRNGAPDSLFGSFQQKMFIFFICQNSFNLVSRTTFYD